VIGFGDLSSGRGRDDELSRASENFVSRYEGGFLGSDGVFGPDPEDSGREAGREVGRELDGLVALTGESTVVPADPSGAREFLAPSFARLDLVLVGVTVCALVGLAVSLSRASDISSPDD
jgi:hypothetical protein